MVSIGSTTFREKSTVACRVSAGDLTTLEPDGKATGCGHRPWVVRSEWVRLPPASFLSKVC